ncbi:MAG: hypothetical protein LBO62_02155 [Endomicrobium sp.]|jgi:hypothetical protein|nr:hypothetical protein [Endomicrobium sp.]
MSSILALFLKLSSFGFFVYGIFVIVKWYINWISYYFIGDIKPSLIVGLATFFLSPLAVVVDLVWHSLQKSAVDAAVIFAACLIGGRILLFMSEKIGPRN